MADADLIGVIVSIWQSLTVTDVSKISYGEPYEYTKKGRSVADADLIGVSSPSILSSA